MMHVRCPHNLPTDNVGITPKNCAKAENELSRLTRDAAHEQSIDNLLKAIASIASWGLRCNSLADQKHHRQRSRRPFTTASKCSKFSAAAAITLNWSIWP
jgi:hypothetical protein